MKRHLPLLLAISFIGSTSQAEVSRTVYNDVVNKIAAAYEPIVKKAGAQLVMLPSDDNWNNTAVSAFADRWGSEWLVDVYGGAAKHPKATPDSLALWACSAVGLHLGGAPIREGHSWLSYTSEASYFAAAKCMRLVLEKGEYWKNRRPVPAMALPPVVIKRCETSFSATKEQEICQRTAVAMETLLAIFAELKGWSVPSFTTPDNTVAAKTTQALSAQCWLDTYLAGAVCPVSHHVALDNKDIYKGACSSKTRTAENPYGERSACWFREKDFLAQRRSQGRTGLSKLGNFFPSSF